MPTYTLDQTSSTDYSEYATSPTTLTSLSSVEVIAYDLVYLSFSRNILVDTISRSIDTFKVYDKATGNSLVIKSVLINSKETSVSEIQLVVQGLIVGSDYTVYIDPRLSDYLGKHISPVHNFKQFTMRRTKVDSILGNVQALYDKRPESQIRHLLTCLAKEDDLLGGSKDDLL